MRQSDTPVNRKRYKGGRPSNNGKRFLAVSDDEGLVSQVLVGRRGLSWPLAARGVVLRAL